MTFPLALLLRARRAPWTPPVLAGGALSLLLATAGVARADEIRLLDPASCEPVTEQAADIGEENWTQIAYRPKAGQAIKRIDTRLVLEIKRSADDSQSNAFRNALAEYQNGNWAAARQAFGNVAGGGLTQDALTGKIVNRPFPALEPGKTKWYAGYAHYYYAASIYREGLAKNDNALLENALNALDADTANEKGFLVRYKEGKSRYYGDALLLKGNILLALKKYDEATAVFDALYQKTLTVPIGARFSYDAKLGAGRIAEAKGDAAAAEAAYEAAAAAMQSLLDQPQDPCSRHDLGRFFNEARMQKARVMRQAAEKADSPPEYARLRTYLLQGSPDALRQKLAGKPTEVVDAVLSGALAPTVQAIAQNGIGLAYLSEKKYPEAVFAFTNVRIKYFSVADEVPRALYYLAKAADAAAAASTKPEAKALFKEQAAAARQELQRSWKESEFAGKP